MPNQVQETETEKHSKIFDREDNINKQTNKFLKGLKRVIHIYFRKVNKKRIKKIYINSCTQNGWMLGARKVKQV